MHSSLVHISLHMRDACHYIEHFCPYSVLVLGPEDCFVQCNTMFLETTGYSLQALASETLSRLLGVEFVQLLDQGGATGSNDFDQLFGKVTVAESSGQLIQTRYGIFRMTLDGIPGYSFIHLYDVRPERELTLLQQFAGTLMRDINLGVILFDTGFRLMDISDMACRVLGFSRQEVLNKSIDEAFSSVPPEHRLVQRSIFDGIVVRNHAVSWTNGSDRYELLLDSNLLRNDAGNTVGGYLTFKDVTNIRSLEEQVQRSDRLAMIGQIAAGTAHEIRNPLTSIKGFMQVLRGTFIDNGMQREQGYADIMLTEIDRINDLVSEFLLLSKRKNVTYDHVVVTTVTKEILPIIQYEALLHGITVQYVPSELPVTIIADRELLKQVFLNISKNGIEAMGEGGTLTLVEKVDLAERKLHVEIHDSGPGIPVFVIDKIFDPFFTTKSNGTGLGLSVCQRIVHDMGGIIRVSSKGYGTTFTVSIPLPS